MDEKDKQLDTINTNENILKSRPIENDVKININDDNRKKYLELRKKRIHLQNRYRKIDKMEKNEGKRKKKKKNKNKNRENAEDEAYNENENEYETEIETETETETEIENEIGTVKKKDKKRNKEKKGKKGKKGKKKKSKNANKRNESWKILLSLKDMKQTTEENYRKTILFKNRKLINKYCVYIFLGVLLIELVNVLVYFVKGLENFKVTSNNIFFGLHSKNYRKPGINFLVIMLIGIICIISSFYLSYIYQQLIEQHPKILMKSSYFFLIIYGFEVCSFLIFLGKNIYLTVIFILFISATFIVVLKYSFNHKSIKYSVHLLKKYTLFSINHFKIRYLGLMVGNTYGRLIVIPSLLPLFINAYSLLDKLNESNFKIDDLMIPLLDIFVFYAIHKISLNVISSTITGIYSQFHLDELINGREANIDDNDDDDIDYNNKDDDDSNSKKTIISYGDFNVNDDNSLKEIKIDIDIEKDNDLNISNENKIAQTDSFNSYNEIKKIDSNLPSTEEIEVLDSYNSIKNKIDQTDSNFPSNDYVKEPQNNSINNDKEQTYSNNSGINEGNQINSNNSISNREDQSDSYISSSTEEDFSLYGSSADTDIDISSSDEKYEKYYLNSNIISSNNDDGSYQSNSDIDIIKDINVYYNDPEILKNDDIYQFDYRTLYYNKKKDDNFNENKKKNDNFNEQRIHKKKKINYYKHNNKYNSIVNDLKQCKFNNNNEKDDINSSNDDNIDNNNENKVENEKKDEKEKEDDKEKKDEKEKEDDKEKKDEKEKEDIDDVDDEEKYKYGRTTERNKDILLYKYFLLSVREQFGSLCAQTYLNIIYLYIGLMKIIVILFLVFNVVMIYLISFAMIFIEEYYEYEGTCGLALAGGIMYISVKIIQNFILPICLPYFSNYVDIIIYGQSYMTAYTSNNNLKRIITSTLPVKIIKYMGAAHCAAITAGICSLLSLLLGYNALNSLVVFIGLSEFFIGMINFQPFTSGAQAANYCYFRNKISTTSCDSFVASCIQYDSQNLGTESFIKNYYDNKIKILDEKIRLLNEKNNSESNSEKSDEKNNEDNDKRNDVMNENDANKNNEMNNEKEKETI